MPTGEPLPIPHEGRKPDWLEDDALVRIDSGPELFRAAAVNFYALYDFKYHLPADHWAAPVLRAGLTPWNPKLQGEGPPKDYAGRKVMMRDGKIVSDGSFNNFNWNWQYTEQVDIIGFEPVETIVSRDPQPLPDTQAVDTNGLASCADCQSSCRPTVFGPSETIEQPITLFMCCNSVRFGGNCKSEAYLSADAWNSAVVPLPDTRVCRICDGGPGNDCACSCGSKLYDTPPLPDTQADAPADEMPPLPSYGEVNFSLLRSLVSEACCGVREDRGQEHPDGYPGHETVTGINYNSLNRIVTAFMRRAATLPDTQASDSGLVGVIGRLRARVFDNWQGGQSHALYTLDPEEFCRVVDDRIATLENELAEAREAVKAAYWEGHKDGMRGTTPSLSWHDSLALEALSRIGDRS